jgi:hypothetical protein
LPNKNLNKFISEIAGALSLNKTNTMPASKNKEAKAKTVNNIFIANSL